MSGRAVEAAGVAALVASAVTPSNENQNTGLIEVCGERPLRWISD